MTQKPGVAIDRSPIAQSIASEVVNELFLRFGIDCKDPEEVKALKADFTYLRKARAGSEDLLRVMRRSAITVAIGAIGYALWAGVVHLISLPGTR